MSLRTPAYARLVGNGLTYDIQELPLYLGRFAKSEHSRGAQREKNFVQIGASRTVSRLHALISWDEQNRCYAVTSLSKNGIEVDSEFHSGKGEAIPLRHKSRLAIGTHVVYFLMPLPESNPSDTMSTPTSSDDDDLDDDDLDDDDDDDELGYI